LYPFEELYLTPLELELRSGALSLEDDDGISSLELLIMMLELLITLELLNFATLELNFGSSCHLSLLELDSSLSPQKTSNKLSLPSLHPKTASERATANKKKRILAI